MKTKLLNFLKKSQVKDKPPLKEGDFPGYNIPKKDSKKKKFISDLQQIMKELKGKSNEILIFMELNNGEFTHFFVEANKPVFMFKQKAYVLDPMFKDYLKSLKSYFLWYHESLCLPIKVQANVTKLVDNISNSDFEIEHSTNPETLENFITSKIAEGIMKGQKIEEFMEQVKIFSIASLVVTGLSFFVIIAVLVKLLGM